MSGFAGAGHVSTHLEKMLQEREEHLDFLLDEGMFVMQVKTKTAHAVPYPGDHPPW